MSIATNKATVRRYIEQVYNEGQQDLVDEFLDEAIEIHGSGLEPGLENVKQWLAMFTAAFPDKHLSLEDVVAEEDRVAVRITTSGTHLGEMLGIPPTGKSVSISGITFFRLVNGKIAEAWLVNDELGMMRQLGIISAPDTV